MLKLLLPVLAVVLMGSQALAQEKPVAQPADKPLMGCPMMKDKPMMGCCCCCKGMTESPTPAQPAPITK